MLEEIMITLGIGGEAINLLKTISFLCVTLQEQDEFINDCRERDVQYINRYLIKLRKKKILEEGYQSAREFETAFHLNKMVALERLLQEPISDFNLKNLRCEDPQHIYNIHKKRGQFIRFNELALYA
ncbi:hypothetical protein GRF59_14835 [Paenibacillus sp. HJL G12]|uniref:Uncharacterized protein n=1 Tax=Paenibacillus dendrobii TaxID=2691084 RepID=A0A7X3ILK1_9BACL|nr:hypothetical protein [Paenibacillus dendrobii]MWV44895.1 hypothetical protein [Paenibacillus dendrobii]